MFDSEFDSSFSGGGGFVGSQSNAGDRKPGSRGKQSKMAPVAIITIHEMLPGQETLRIGSEEFSGVTVVGIVRSVTRNGPAIFYEIDDMSGPPITARLYSDGSEETIPAMENTYVRVYGSIKTFEEKPSIMCYAVKPLLDLNELTAHLLEIVQCKMFYTKDVIRIVKERSMGAPMTYGAATGGSSYQQQTGSNIRPGGNQSMTGSYVHQQQNRGFGGPSGDIRNQVYAYLKESHLDEGVSVKDLKMHFKNVSEHDLRLHLDYLCGEGQIYTTMDDEHFRVTD